MLEMQLEEIRDHWGDAYIINCLAPDRWIAQRRDNARMIEAESQEKLFELIRADYNSEPVRRNFI